MNKKSFNQRLYSSSIRNWIPDINEDDELFLCNASSNTYRSVKSAGCVDNYRVSRISETGDASQKYEEARDNGCCGSIDKKVTNRKSGNEFIIGFNFGH